MSILIFITQAGVTGSVENDAVCADFSRNIVTCGLYELVAWFHVHIIYMMACVTYKVIVRLCVAVEMVTVFTLNFQGLPVFDEQRQITVYGSKTYIRIYVLNMPVYLFCGRV